MNNHQRRTKETRAKNRGIISQESMKKGTLIKAFSK
jgi:hypothetical protein